MVEKEDAELNKYRYKIKSKKIVNKYESHLFDTKL
jgi:hypothetical protein